LSQTVTVPHHVNTMSRFSSSSSSPLHPLPDSRQRRHPTAADRAAARLKRSAPAECSSPSQSTTPASKHRRIDPASAVCSDENVDTSNTTAALSAQTFAISSPPSSCLSPQPAADSSLTLSIFSSHSGTASVSLPSWCDCGHCIDADDVAMQTCCCHISPAALLPVNSPPLCESADVAAVIRDGVSSVDFEHYSRQRIRGKDRPQSFAACNAAQKRLMVYAVLHRLLYHQGFRGQRDPLPECIKHMVRARYADEQC